MRLQITAYKVGEVLGSGSYSQERIPRVKIGSAEDMHLRVEEPGVADEHAEVYILKGRAYARPLGDATVWLNGVELEEESKLGKGDRLKISDTIEFTVAVVEKRKEPESDSKSRVGPSGGRISFNKFIDVAGKTENGSDGRTVEKLKKKPPEKEPEEAAPERGPKVRRRLSKLDVIKIVLILIMVLVLFGLVIIPTIRKLMIS